MIHLSKSKYCNLWRCPKMAWLAKYKPEVAVIDDSLAARLDSGSVTGDLAMGLFGDYVEVTTFNEDGTLNLPAMIERTKEEMAKGTSVICEAAITYEGLYCAVDILKKEGDGYAIYEVKSSTTSKKKNEIKPIYIADISYQKYVLDHCGINVTGTYIVTLNGDYVRGDELDLSELFNIHDVSGLIAKEYSDIEKNLAIAEEILSCDKEPDICLSTACHDPYDCFFKSYCMRDIPKPSVFDLSGMTFKKKLELYYSGIVTYEQLLESKEVKKEKQLRQIDHHVNDRPDYANVPKIKEFLDTLYYPLYFLDFESMQFAVPEYPGTKPYQQISFQYSLHYIEKEGGELKHKEFIATPGTDPRRALAEALCRDIPQDVCVMVYNMVFERGRIYEMATTFPDLADHLLNIHSNIKDLMVPFQQEHYYNKAMDGSYTIKKVLPALFPDDPELNYHNLEGIQNGGDAMTIYPKIKDMPKEEQEKAIRNLFKYCELDTYALVKIWGLLKERCKNV